MLSHSGHSWTEELVEQYTLIIVGVVAVVVVLWLLRAYPSVPSVGFQVPVGACNTFRPCHQKHPESYCAELYEVVACADAFAGKTHAYAGINDQEGQLQCKNPATGALLGVVPSASEEAVWFMSSKLHLHLRRPCVSG
jgi:hypothetical protein